ncbi:hypothetical protein [Mucilaginibacter aquatilis]|uniref:PH domain-containing protein n=1 Tax=Mucilaginibacter aquatilis TaxID=1517760 RepID=A0A6I4I6F4_9SPHI|nr:hypothetical protein [Mucilaginibacter aquatilis]MVN90720.1 hypothetical protein [Mucilaginibacter aquatilis]
MTEVKPVYIEKQYLGREWIPVSIRLVLAMLCFAIFFFTDTNERNADLLVVVGFAIVIISVILGFVVHFTTRVQNGSILLNGLWTTKLVKIDLNSIVKAEKGQYSRYLVNNPVYNLHSKGTIRFYTAGSEAIHLTDRDGLIYIIGSQHSNDFLRAIDNEMAQTRVR